MLSQKGQKSKNSDLELLCKVTGFNPLARTTRIDSTEQVLRNLVKVKVNTEQSRDLL